MALQNKTFSELINFTRNSEATRFGPTGVLERVPAGEPRFDYDPVTLEANGLLVEPQRTNVVYASEILPFFTLANGTRPNTLPLGSAMLVNNCAYGPDGEFNAFQVAPSNASDDETGPLAAISVNRDTFGAGSGATLTAKISVKKNPEAPEYRYFSIGTTNSGGQYAGFDLDTGTFVSAGDSGLGQGASARELGDGWWEITHTLTVSTVVDFSWRATVGGPTNTGAGAQPTLYKSGLCANYMIVERDYAGSHVYSDAEFISRASSAWAFNSSGNLIEYANDVEAVNHAYDGSKWVRVATVPQNQRTNLFANADTVSANYQSTAGYTEVAGIVPWLTYSYELNTTGILAQQAGGVVDNNLYFLTFVVKMEDGAKPVIGSSTASSAADFVIIRNNAISPTSATSNVFTDLGGGVWMIQHAFQAGSGLDTFGIAKYSGNNSKKYTAAIIDLQEGITPSLPIISSGGATTRAAEDFSLTATTAVTDDAYLDTTHWHRQSEGVFSAEVSFNYTEVTAGPPNKNQYVFDSRDQNLLNGAVALISVVDDPAVSASVRSGVETNFSVSTAPVVDPDTPTKIAVTWDSSGFQLSQDGAASLFESVDLSAGIASDRLYIGRSRSTIAQDAASIKIKNLEFTPKRLSEAELNAKTT